MTKQRTRHENMTLLENAIKNIKSDIENVTSEHAKRVLLSELVRLNESLKVLLQEERAELTQKKYGLWTRMKYAIKNPGSDPTIETGTLIIVGFVCLIIWLGLAFNLLR